MYYLIIYPSLIIFMIFIQGFLSNSEMAVVSSNRYRIQHLSKSGNKRAGRILFLLDNPEMLFGTTLLGINFATILSSSLADIFFHKYLYDYLHFIERFINIELFVLIIMEPLVLVFGELFPMSLARKYPNVTALNNSFFLGFFYMILYPFMIIPNFISRTISKLASRNAEKNISRDELELLVTGGFSGFNNRTQEYIKDFFDINELTAQDIMVHLDKVVAISEDAAIADLKKLVNESNHSRLPVYKGNIFNIVATIHAINILGVDEKEVVSHYSDKLYIVPSTKPVIKILSELKTNRKYMGIVVDEYGAVCGIITIKDILREIVGEIHDEFDSVDIGENNTEVNIYDAEIKLDDFYEETGIDFREEEVETLGGVINLALGRIGRRGEKVIYKGINFEIINATDRVVKKVKIISV